MLKRFVLAFVLGVSPAFADGKPAEPEAPYPHLYQAPLFGALFDIAASEASVDESALRYYASLRNFARADAEIRRLKALHPKWTPPTNIYAAAGAGADEQPFWDLLAADRLDELRAGLGLKERSTPGWKPSRDLLAKIARKETIKALVKASESNQPGQALAVADRDPTILHCAYMDASWRVADAFLSVGLPKRAYEIYHAILAACPDHDDRLATVRKAVSRFPAEEVKALIGMGARSADGAGEFDAAKLDLTRARIADVNQGKAQDTIEPEALVDYFAEVARTKVPADLGLAGWFEFNRFRFAEAERWFALAKPGPDALNLIEGRALALVKLGRLEDALGVAYPWRDASAALRDAYAGAAATLLAGTAELAPKLVADFASFVQTNKHAAGAESLGWRRFNNGEWDEAAVWFQRALVWRGADPHGAPPAGEIAPEVSAALTGYGRALAHAGRVDEAAAVADRWRGAGAALEAAFLELMGAAIDAAPSASALAPDSLAHFAQVALARKSAPAARALGWLGYRSADLQAAVDWFRRALAWGPSNLSASQGLALSLKGLGRLAEAEDVAWGFARESADMRAIYISAVVAELADDRTTLSPSRVDRFTGVVAAQRSAAGAQALGWRRLKQGHCVYAAPWFRKAAAWSADAKSDAGTARGLALSLKAVGAYAAAQDLAYAWRDRDPELRALYVDIGVENLMSEAPVVAMSPARMSRLSQEVLAGRHVRGAQALGWRRYREAACGFGGDWLRLAIAWTDEDKRDAKTDEGYGLTLRTTGRLDEAAGVAYRWQASVPLMRKLYIDTMVERLSRDNPPEPVEETRLEDFAAVIAPIQSALGAQALGWYRLERHEFDEAAHWFKQALDWQPPLRRDVSQRLSAPVDDYRPILGQLALTHADYRRTPRAYPNSSALIGKSREAYVNTEQGLSKTVEGYLQALRELGRFDEAEALAFKLRERWPFLARVTVDFVADLLGRDGLALAPDRLARFASVIEEARSAPAASAYGWRLTRANAPEAATLWFQRALGWSKTSPPDIGLVEGYVGALQAQKKYDEAAKLAGRWRGASPRFDLLRLTAELMLERAAGRPLAATLAEIARVEGEIETSRSPEASLALGWLAYEARDYARALGWFEKSADWGDSVKAREGRALCLRALDRFEDLAALGADRAASPVLREAYYAGMIAWSDAPAAAREAFAADVRADRHIGGMEALGWRAIKHAEWREARDWFEAALERRKIDPSKPSTEAAEAKTVEGYVQALRGLSEAERAEEIAFLWPGLANLYAEIAEAALAGDALAPARLARFQTFAESRRSPEAATALGWRAYRGQSPQDAARWFERALSWSTKPGAKLVEGYALALRAAGRLAQAESFAYAHAEIPELRAVYLAVAAAELSNAEDPLSPARLARFAAVTLAARSAPAAEALGWRRLAEDNCVYAAPWFRRAAAWSVAEARPPRGLVLALRKAGAYARAEDIAFAWSDRAPEMRGLYLETAAEALTAPGPVSEARLARLAQRTIADRSAKAALALGWRRLAEPDGYSARWFALAANWSQSRDPKADEGQALALGRLGRLAEAEAVLKPAPTLRALYIETVAAALARDNPPEPFEETRLKDFVAQVEAAHSPLGAQALGWYRIERGEAEEAARWFARALGWWPARRHDGGVEVAAPAENYRPILARLALDPRDYRRTPRAYLRTPARAAPYIATEAGFAKTQEGYALALRTLGRTEEAEGLAFGWRDRWPALRALYLDIAAAELDRRDGPALDPQRLQRFLDAVEADRFAPGAAAMAWRQYRLGSHESAALWFQRALAWTEGDPARGLVEGYVLALQGAKKFDDAAAAAARWRNASPELNLVYVQSELQRLRAAGRAGEVTPQKFAEIEKTFAGAQSAEGALALAWIAYETHDYAHALVWFRKAQGWGDEAQGTKAEEGVALSLRALERFEDLAELGFPRRAGSPAVREAYFAGMVAWLTSDKPLRNVPQQARADFAQAVAEERSIEGEQALAWGALMRGDWLLARREFETALAWSDFDPAALVKPDPARAKLVEGYVQALRASGELERAEDIAFLWRDAASTLGGLYLEIVTQELAVDAVALSETRIARFGELAKARRSPPAAGALGWRAYRAKGYAQAIRWFEQAAAFSPGGQGEAKISEGYALSLRAAGRLVEAEDFAWAHRGQSHEIRAAYVAAFSDQLLDPKLSPRLPARRLARFAEIVSTDRLGAGAAALGWRRLQDGNCGYSLGWFRKAIAWSEQGRDDAKLHAGLAQGLRAVGLFNQAEDAAYAFAHSSTEARELYLNIGIEELTRRWPRVAMSESRIARFAAVTASDRSAKAAQALGWRRYGEAGCGYGGRWFELSAAWSADARGDAHLNEGYALSQRAVGRLARAERLAYPWIERAPAMKKLYIDIAVEELSRDNPPEPIPEERIAAFEASFLSVRSALGAQALGWYRYNRRELEASARWFAQALDWWPPRKTDANQKLAAPVDDYQVILARLALKPEDYRRTPRAYPNSSLLIGHDAESYVDTDIGLAKTVEGYVRALAALGRYGEAESLASRWLDRWPPLRAALIEAFAAELVTPGASLPDDRLARLMRLVEEDRSATGAEALGWRAYRLKDYAGAERWLRAALDWRPVGVNPPLELARAYADSLRGLRRYDDALRFVSKESARAPGLETFAVDIALDNLGALDSQSAGAADKLREIAAGVAARKSPGGALSLGWLAHNRQEYPGAEAWFRKAIEWTPSGADPDAKALEGFARALQAEGRAADAMRFTAEWSAREPSLKPLYLEAAAAAFAAAAGSGEDVPADGLARAGKAFAEARSAAGAQALAWQRLAQKDAATALAWFQAARSWNKTPDEDPKATEGAILALRALHRDDEAEALAYQAGAHDAGLLGLYVETIAERLTRKGAAPPDEAGLRRFADAVASTQSANGAQALGWHAFNLKQYAAAAAWFEKSLAFSASENAALGAALAYRRLRDRDAYARVVESYRDAYARIGALARGGNLRERRAALENGEAPQKRFRQSLAPSGGGDRNAEGWRLINQGRPMEAARAFDATLKTATGRARRDAAYGRSLALLAAGDGDGAARAAQTVALSAPQRQEVGVQLLERRAWDAYEAGRFTEALHWLDRRAAYVPETRALMQMRSWSLAKLGRTEASADIRAQLERQLAP